MLFSYRAYTLAWAALAATLCNAGPVAVPAVAPNPVPVLISRPHYVEATHVNEKRSTASFDLAHTWDNDILFDHVVQSADNNDKIEFKVSPMSYFFDPMLRLDFSGVEAYVDLSLAINGSATYAINLFTSQTPAGIGSDEFEAGVIFAVDLVFHLSAELDIGSAGFYVKLAEGAYVEASMTEGVVGKSFLDGVVAKAIPIKVNSGSATFVADLRLRTQAGLSAELAGFGAELLAGVYANIIELVTVVGSSSTCGLETTEFFDLNVGAFAHADVVADSKTFGPVPTVSTTLLTLPIATQCWDLPANKDAVASTLSDTAINAAPTISSTLTSSCSVVPSSAAASVTTSNSAATFSSVSSSSHSYSNSTSSYSKGTSGSASSSAPSYSSKSAPAFESSSATSCFSASSSASSSNINYSPTNSTIYSRSTPSPAALYAPSSGHLAIVSSSAASFPFSENPVTQSAGVATAVVYSTKTFTITSCKATVVNCPASLQTAFTVTKTYTYTKESGAGASVAQTTTTTTASQTDLASTTSITNVIVMVPCETPIVHTFKPTDVPAPAASTRIAVEVPTAGKGTFGTPTFSAVFAASATITASAGGKNGTLSGTYMPTVTKTSPSGLPPTSSSAVVVTAGAAASGLNGGFVALVGMIAGVMLL